MTSFFAVLHYLAAFTLVGALATELVLTNNGLAAKNARAILLVDLTYGVSAAVVLIIGLLRAVYFEKGTSYYFQCGPFVVKGRSS